jgi:uncharacterized protein
MNFLKELAKYCFDKSNEICKEVLPMLVTNGTLLDKGNIDILQSLGYIFGISIDGYKDSHDRNRLNKLGKGTYKQIIRNIKNIKHREYLGVAVTLTNSKMDLVKAFRSLYKYFTTISIKLVRSFDNTVEGINEFNIDEIKDEYTKLYKHILNKTLKGNLDNLGVLLNGDDYLGKFILRVILNQKVSTRCDAGLGRFSLTPDKKIIACPGSIGIEELEIGDLFTGLEEQKINIIWNVLSKREYCKDCIARYVCGGECLIVSYYKDKKIDSIDKVMCELKKHLFKLAVKFKFEVLIKSEELFKVIYEGCLIKANRFQEDKEFSETLSKLEGNYTYMELKMIKDDNPIKYEKIKEDLE